VEKVATLAADAFLKLYGTEKSSPGKKTKA